MADIIIRQMPTFKKAYKKLHVAEQSIVDNAVRAIVEDSKIGQGKRGDLTDVFVYKFKIRHQEMLLAYEWTEIERLLLALGKHENFYRDLKKQS